MMAIGRMLYGIFGAKIPLKPTLFACGLLGLACYLTAAFCSQPALALIACALCGLSVSLMWPGTLSSTSARFPGAGSLFFALMAVAGDIGCSLGPWLSGLTTDLVIAHAPAQRLAQLGLSAEQLGAQGWYAGRAPSSACCCLRALPSRSAAKSAKTRRKGNPVPTFHIGL